MLEEREPLILLKSLEKDFKLNEALFGKNSRLSSWQTTIYIGVRKIKPEDHAKKSYRQRVSKARKIFALIAATSLERDKLRYFHPNGW